MKALSAATTMAVLIAAGFAQSATAQCNSSWRRDAVGGLNGRVNHALVYDTARQRVVLYGGEGPTILSEMYWWDGAAWIPIENEDGPLFRTGHAMAYDIARDRIVLFGGRINTNNNALGGDTWEFDGTTWSQVATTGPQARRDAAMVYDAARGRCVLFGGQQQISGYYHDTWEWNGVSWVSVPAGDPGPSGFPSMAYDSDRAVSVLTDGRSVWEYAGVQWQLVNSSGPFVRYKNGICYDAVRHKTVIFGGSLTPFYNEALPDTWTWDGTSWTMAAGCGPGFRFRTALAFDALRGRVLAYGGMDRNTGLMLPSTWTWDGVPSVAVPVFVSQPTHQTVVEGASVQLTSAAISSSAISFQWRRNGQPISNGSGGASPGGGQVSGAQAASVWILSPLAGDSGDYDVVATNELGQVVSNVAHLTVNPAPPPLNCDPVTCYANCDHSTHQPCLTANDFQCFLNAFATGDSYANCDGTTTVPNLTANDFQCYLNAYAVGCSH